MTREESQHRRMTHIIRLHAWAERERKLGDRSKSGWAADAMRQCRRLVQAVCADPTDPNNPTNPTRKQRSKDAR
jgi:hypothetical protein